MHILPKRPHELARFVFLVFLGAVAILLASGLSSILFSLRDPRPGCETPLQYRIGEVDPRFPLGERAFRLAIFQAEAVWEDALGRDILQYAPGSDFLVTTAFDERQKMTYDSRVLESRIAEYEETAETLSERYEAQKTRYDRDKAALERRIADFETDLRDYNQDVSHVNARGGATEKEFEDLEEAKEHLEDEQEAISDEADRLNAVAAELNEIAIRINTEVADVNAEVASFRETYGDPQPFVQGLYDPKVPSITIYQFERMEDLRLVLAHEFGHALGIDTHVESDPSALMYYLMDGQDIVNPSLTTADIAAYTGEACPPRTVSTRERIVRYLVSRPLADIRLSELLPLFSGVDSGGS
jgi:uncharacterized coiled-coil protein SlyX